MMNKETASIERIQYKAHHIQYIVHLCDGDVLHRQIHLDSWLIPIKYLYDTSQGRRGSCIWETKNLYHRQSKYCSPRSNKRRYPTYNLIGEITPLLGHQESSNRWWCRQLIYNAIVDVFHTKPGNHRSNTGLSIWDRNEHVCSLGLISQLTRLLFCNKVALCGIACSEKVFWWLLDVLYFIMIKWPLCFPNEWIVCSESQLEQRTK